MFVPPKFVLTEQQAITDLINENSFGLVVSSELEATHLPFHYKEQEGKLGCLYGHFARANKHWQLAQEKNVLVVFSGPHSYISPTYYQHQPAVPTWNYTAVHCYGKLTLLDNHQTSEMMDDLVAQYEPKLNQDKDTMPDDYRQKLQQAVVGFKISLTGIQAKEKLGQHKKAEDQAAVYQALKQSPYTEAQELATYMEQRELGLG